MRDDAADLAAHSAGLPGDGAAGTRRLALPVVESLAAGVGRRPDTARALRGAVDRRIRTDESRCARAPVWRAAEPDPQRRERTVLLRDRFGHRRVRLFR